MIVLKPTGGLCNRLRAIDSGVLLSEKINKPLRVLWMLSPDLNCSYNSLFESPKKFTVVNVKAAQRSSFKLVNKVKFLYDYGMARVKYQHVIFQTQMGHLREQGYDFTQLSKYRSVYITCCNRFYRTERKFQPLEPIPIIRSAVEAIAKKYSPHTVGVHIRRTDHHAINPHSSIQGFIDAMNVEIEQNPDTKFYLATDSAEVMSQLTQFFEDRIIWRSKDYGRNTQSGIQDALIDLLCLSRASKIIGSRFSSFSGTAAQLNDIPAVYITSETGGEV